MMLARKNLSAKERQDATRFLDAAAGLLPKAAKTCPGRAWMATSIG